MNERDESGLEERTDGAEGEAAKYEDQGKGEAALGFDEEAAADNQPHGLAPVIEATDDPKQTNKASMSFSMCHMISLVNNDLESIKM